MCLYLQNRGANAYEPCIGSDGVVAGRDAVAGGTWMGLNTKTGFILCSLVSFNMQ